MASTLHFLCGKMASGKSTLAAKIALEAELILLSEDQLLAGLFPGEIADVTDYVKYSSRVKSTLEAHLCELLSRGISVVLDFPANTPGQRRWFREVLDASGASHQLHLIDCSDEVCKERLLFRVIEQPERKATDTAEMFDAMAKYFEPPTVVEGFSIVRYDGENR